MPLMSALRQDRVVTFPYRTPNEDDARTRAAYEARLLAQLLGVERGFAPVDHLDQVVHEIVLA